MLFCWAQELYHIVSLLLADPILTQFAFWCNNEFTLSSIEQVASNL